MPRTLNLIAVCALALAVCAPDAVKTRLRSETWRDRRKRTKPISRPRRSSPTTTWPSNSGRHFYRARRRARPGHATGNGGQIRRGSSPLRKASKSCNRCWTKLDSLDRATLASNVLEGNTSNFPGRARWEEQLFAAKQDFVSENRDVLQKMRQLDASAEGLKDVQDPNDPRAKSMSAKLQELMQESQHASAAFQAVIAEGKDLAAQGDAH